MEEIGPFGIARLDVSKWYGLPASLYSPAPTAKAKACALRYFGPEVRKCPSEGPGFIIAVRKCALTGIGISEPTVGSLIVDRCFFVALIQISLIKLNQKVKYK